jgi:AcrR family transcriptional regulator
MAATKSSPLRDAHRDLTRTRIVDAALDLMRAGDEAAFTVAAVAAAAGMTERTVYRHFETRDALMAAAWRRINEVVKTPALPDTPEALIAQPLTAFPFFDEEEVLMRAIVATREGRELRLSVNAERQAGMRAAVRAARPDLQEPEFTRLCAVVQLLDSSFAWLMMKDYWGLDGHEAGRAASAAIARLLDYDRGEPS